MRILHTEASPGWGGQEIRILREAEGMRARGHELVFAVKTGGLLVPRLSDAGFLVYEVSFERGAALKCVWDLFRIMRRHDVDVVNTHSSLDSWMGGVAARMARRRLIRTRHLSTRIRAGLNSRVLYNWLADRVVTTCQGVVPMIREQAGLSDERCLSIPTGVDPSRLEVDADAGRKFREALGIADTDFVVGTVCILRVWKGVSDLLGAAKLLAGERNLKFLVVGGGVSEEYYRKQWRDLGLEDSVIFTGHLEDPYSAMQALDVFALLSTANEGVSQAVLQAAYLGKPLITTVTGGLGEVCLPERTGINVPVNDPEAVADAVRALHGDAELCREYGSNAHDLVMERFTFDKMLDEMEAVMRHSIMRF